MSLSLTRSTVVSTEPLPGQHTWPLEVTAVSTTPNLPSEIFVYHSSMGDDPLVGDLFECVASLNQLDEIGLTPVDTELETIPYYRSAALTFSCRSAQEAEDLWMKVQADALDLLNNFKAINNLTEVETVAFE